MQPAVPGLIAAEMRVFRPNLGLNVHSGPQDLAHFSSGCGCDVLWLLDSSKFGLKYDPQPNSCDSGDMRRVPA
ncbi:MAG: hypothetical protein DWI22_19055 [Planctomycetota bacterium]|nr:MAG: hypothetical protein DWI22_19055 [Planctomycetota bacterium]